MKRTQTTIAERVRSTIILVVIVALIAPIGGNLDRAAMSTPWTFPSTPPHQIVRVMFAWPSSAILGMQPNQRQMWLR